MSTAHTSSSRPRNLTDAVRARQARLGVRPVDGAGAASRSPEPKRNHTSHSEASSRPGAAQQDGDGNGGSLLSRLLKPLKSLGDKLLDALEGLFPGPVRAMLSWLESAVSGERGFGFWWVTVTFGIALGVGALVALLVSPIAALVALLGVGIWMLFRREREENGDEDHSDERDDERSDEDDENRTGPAADDAGEDSEREPAAVPSAA